MFDIASIYIWLKTRFNRLDALLILVLIFLFFVTRLGNIKNLPIFVDEGIYIRWAKSASINGDLRFISLTDGRQPLQTWATIPFLKVLPQDPLLAGRLFGVLSGLLALAGVMITAGYLFGKRSAWTAGLLYIFTPYFLFYDRLAMVDSFVNASAIWLFFLSTLLVRLIRFDLAVVVGLFMGVALLAKSTTQLFMGLSFLAPLILLCCHVDWRRRMINSYILFGLVGFIALIIYNIQRLSNNFFRIGDKNNTFVITGAQFIRDPLHELSYFVPNLIEVIKLLSWESGLLLIVVAVLGLYKLWQHDRRLTIYLLAWVLIPLCLIGVFNRVLYPRYFLFLAGILLLPATYFVSRLHKKSKDILLFILIFFNMFLNIPIIFNPLALWFPPVDKGQYIINETAGWGINPILEYLRRRAKDKSILLLAEGDFGLSRDMFEAMLTPQDKIFVKGGWPLTKEFLLANQYEMSKMSIYIVKIQRSDKLENIPQDWPIKLVKEFRNPISGRVWQLFEMNGKM